jgi:hypothetical protein
VTTNASAVLSHALTLATLRSTFADLPAAERAAFFPAAEAARAENPLDPALVEIIVMLAVASRAHPLNIPPITCGFDNRPTF